MGHPHEDTVNRTSQPPVICFALGVIGLGVIAIVTGDFAEMGQTVAAWVPGRTALAYASGIVMVLGGIALTVNQTRALAVRVLLPFAILAWLSQAPTIVLTPQVEVNWESIGEVTIITSGIWALLATWSALGEGSRLAFATGDRGLRIARILFGLALLPIGISHFAYLANTVSLIPAFFPFPKGWAYLTGAGHFAAGLGVLFGVVPQLAAAMEAGMVGIFTLVVWLPRIIATPAGGRGLWTEFAVSWAITSAAWLIAASYTKKDGPR